MTALDLDGILADVTAHRAELPASVVDCVGCHIAVTNVPALVAEVRRLRADAATPAELSDRQLLIAAHQWARANGWHLVWNGWANAPMERDATTVVYWDDDELFVKRRPDTEKGEHWRMGLSRGERYPITSVRQAVDFLVALDVLPAELSSAYRAAVAG